MTRVVIDASALAAIAFHEPAAAAISQRLDGATVFAPALLKFEMADIARSKARQQSKDAAKILAALTVALSDRWGIIWRDVDYADVVRIADATGASAYDASYLWLAAALDADLVTLDERLARAGEVFSDQLVTPPRHAGAASWRACS